VLLDPALAEELKASSPLQIPLVPRAVAMRPTLPPMYAQDILRASREGPSEGNEGDRTLLGTKVIVTALVVGAGVFGYWLSQRQELSMTESLPDPERWLSWAKDRGVLAALGLFSVLFFVSGVVAVPWIVARLPADHFVGRAPGSVARSTWGRLFLKMLKNLVGVVLLIAGVAMLFLPGQGLLTVLVALSLMDFPGKRRLQARIVRIRPVRAALDAIRRRAGREPLVFDEPRVG
jgi:hypothetical protein